MGFSFRYPFWNSLALELKSFWSGIDSRAERGLWWGNKLIPFDKELLRFNYQGWFDYDKPVNWELEPLAIRVIGNVAIVFSTFKYSGNILSSRGRGMETWIKQDNKWLKIGNFDASCAKLLPCK